MSASRPAARAHVIDEMLRSADQRLRARAAARARGLADALGGARMAAAHQATREAGRQILRQRRAPEPSVAHPAVAESHEVRRSRVLPRRYVQASAVVAALIAAAALAALLRGPSGDEIEGASAAAAQPEAQAVGYVPRDGLFGITSPEFLQRLVAAATPPPPAPPGPPRTAPPVPGTGAGGGSAGSGPARTNAPPPAPTPVILPSPPPPSGPGPLLPGFQRFQGVVIDAASNQPIAGVCISIGPRGCQEISARSDATGTWTVDLPIGGGGLVWDFFFEKGGYEKLHLTHRSNDPPGLTFQRLRAG